MAVNYNPRIVTSGLVLCVDTANSKSFDATENLITYSETFTSPSLWSLLDCTASKNAVDPNGLSNSATTITRNSTAYGGLYVYQPSNGFSVTSGFQYTFSIFLKAGTASSIFVPLETSGAGGVVFSYSGIGVNLTNGTITSGSGGSIVAYPNGWYRVSITETATTTGTAEPGIYSSGTTAFPLNGTMFIWGAQFERAGVASNYHATAGTTKNRSTILTDLTGGGKNGTLNTGASYASTNAGIFNFSGDGEKGSVSFPAGTFVNLAGTEGTFCYWIKFPAGDAVTRYLFDDGGSWPSSVFLYRNDFWTANQWAWAIYYTDTSNNTGWHIQSLTYTPNTWVMTSMTYSSDGQQKIYINDQLMYTGNPTNFSSWKRSGANQPFFGGGGANASVAALLHYNKALSATEISQNFNTMRGRFGI